ncbi:MAG: LCP family protein [Ilumatobacteraceae bacterium]
MNTTTRPRRTWPQRVTVGAAVLAAVASFASAGALATGRWALSQRQLVVIDEPTPTVGSGLGADPSTGTPTEVPPEPAAEVVDGTVEPEAANFLLVGTDNNACLDPGSKYAPYILGRENFGERADVIMVWRVNPDTGDVAALSLPRDLYVRIDGGRQGRINAAFDSQDPNRLINTIRNNFGIETDHYIQVDFCAFKTLVDSVGGVGIPLPSPIRDRGTGLELISSGCTTLDGDDALAYVRSRYLEYERPAGSGNWVIDPSSDWGRIARQQDFIRRTIATVITGGLYQPSVARGLIEANADDVVTDSELSLTTMLGFANTLRTVDTNAISSYQIEATGRTVGGQAVLIPTLANETMRGILDIFQGDSTIDGDPISLSDLEQTSPSATTTTVANAPAGDDPSGDDPSDDASAGPAGEVTPIWGSLIRQAPPDDNTIGWVPDPSIICD